MKHTLLKEEARIFYPDGTVLFWISSFITSLIFGVLFTILRLSGRIRIEGGKNALAQLKKAGYKNVLFISNHPSLWDSALEACALFWPWALMNLFKYLPWQTPDLDNFFRWCFWFRWGPFVGIDRKKADTESFERICRVLPEVMMMIFPEGGRSGNEEKKFIITKNGIGIREPKRAVGGIILACEPLIFPIVITGSEGVFPMSRWLPIPRLKGFFRRKIYIRIGEAVPAEELIKHMPNMATDRQRRQYVIYKVMSLVADLDK